MSQAENALLSAENQSLTVQNERLALEVTQLHEEMAVLNSRVAELQGQITALGHQVESLDAKVAELQADLDFCEGKVSSLSKKNKQLSATIQHLRSQIYQFKSKVRGLKTSMQIDVQPWQRSGLPWFEMALGPTPSDYGVDYRVVAGDWRAAWETVLTDGYRAVDHLWWKPWEHGPMQLTDTGFPCWLYETYDPDPPKPGQHRTGIADLVIEGDAPIKWNLRWASTGAANFGRRLSRYFSLLKDLMNTFSVGDVIVVSRDVSTSATTCVDSVSTGVEIPVENATTTCESDSFVMLDC